MYPLIRNLLFRISPEQAHNLTINLLRLVGLLPPLRAVLSRLFASPPNPLQVFGCHFPNPIGMAAGYDKDALAWRGLACLGFGHIEVGTITPLPQPGNPQPRLFRLPEHQALINRMGFPGKGAQFAARQLQPPKPAGLVLGVNIGKGKHTPLEQAAQDYLLLMEIFAPLADYLAINVSSPNTLGLRQLQARQALADLLEKLAHQRQELANTKPLPLLVKLSPDLSDGEMDDALDVILANGMNGVIATNTTTSRSLIAGHPRAGEAGGLSGAPLRQLSTEMIRKIHQRTQGKLPIIGAGGIVDVASAQEKLEAGACLVQLYTGLIYAGPLVVKEINSRLM